MVEYLGPQILLVLIGMIFLGITRALPNLVTGILGAMFLIIAVGWFLYELFTESNT